MLIYDANDTWDNYRGYIVNLYWNDWITAEDYDLSLEHGRLYKDGKPYTREKDLSFESLNELGYKPRSFENKLLDAQYESAVKHYLEMREYTFNNLLESNTMESVKVTPPEGYEIDPASTTSEIFFRKKKDRPRKWSDLNYPVDGYFIRGSRVILNHAHSVNDDDFKEIWPTKELAEAALALSELMQYRQRWIGGWKPDWNEGCDKYTITRYKDKIHETTNMSEYKIMSFPTREMRVDFFNTFKDLLETAKPLL